MAYVYAYTVAGELWYIGKGSGTRFGRHLRRAKRYAKGLPMHRISPWQIDLANALERGATVNVEILADNLTCDAAFAQEIELISRLRPLKNKLAGGNGCRCRRSSKLPSASCTTSTALNRSNHDHDPRIPQDHR